MYGNWSILSRRSNEIEMKLRASRRFAGGNDRPMMAGLCAVIMATIWSQKSTGFSTSFVANRLPKVELPTNGGFNSHVASMNSIIGETTVQGNYMLPACIAAALGLVASSSSRRVNRRPGMQVIAMKASFSPSQVIQGVASQTASFQRPAIASAPPLKKRVDPVPASFALFVSLDDAADLAGGLDQDVSLGVTATTTSSKSSRRRYRKRSSAGSQKQQRRKVGQRLLTSLCATTSRFEPRFVSFDPSQVPLKLQRALLSNCYPMGSGSREANVAQRPMVSQHLTTWVGYNHSLSRAKIFG